MRVLSRRLLIIAGLTALGWPASAQTMSELYEKAKAEGEQVIYGGGPVSLYEVPAKAFEQKYPASNSPSMAASATSTTPRSTSN
jgi:hypothetical protein